MFFRARGRSEPKEGVQFKSEHLVLCKAVSARRQDCSLVEVHGSLEILLVALFGRLFPIASIKDRSRAKDERYTCTFSFDEQELVLEVGLSRY